MYMPLIWSDANALLGPVKISMLDESDETIWMSRPRGYKTFFMLNSAEHDISMLISMKISRNPAFLRLR